MANVYLILPLSQKHFGLHNWQLNRIAKGLGLDITRELDEVDCGDRSFKFLHTPKDRITYAVMWQNNMKNYLESVQCGIDDCDWVAYWIPENRPHYQLDPQLCYEESYAKLLEKPIRYFSCAL